MEYNDNEYEGQNLHLSGGEESSKVPSVLCSYALPKFDFDDSLQGHLRFDSLVENEVFLGIASQEDHHWIEDFSRGSSVIEFSSSAAESCSLPRRNNVWLEATSSESVEMLLKSVGQEEMIPGEGIIQQTDPGDQFCGGTGQMDSSLKQNDKVDDVKDPDLTSKSEPHGDVSLLNQGTVNHDDNVECSSVVNSEQSRMKCNDDGQVNPCASANESLGGQMPENLSVTGIQNDNTESSLQKVTISVGEFSDLVNVSDIGSLSLSASGKDICERVVEEQKKLNTNDEMLVVSGTATVKSKLGSALGGASEMECTAEPAVETITNFGDLSSVTEVGESLSLVLEQRNGVAGTVEPGNGGKSSTGALSGASEIKPLVVEEERLEKGSSGSFQLDVHATEVTDTGAPEICPNSELNMASEVKRSDGQSSIDKDSDDHGGDRMLEALPITFEASRSLEVQGNPHEQDNETCPNPANDLVNLSDAFVAGGSFGENPTIKEMKDAIDVARKHTEELKVGGGHDGASLVSGSTQMYVETDLPVQKDVPKCDRDHSLGQIGQEKYHFVCNDTTCSDDRREVAFAEIKENVDSGHGSDSKTCVRVDPVLNTVVERTDLASQTGGHNVEHESRLNDTESVNRDENKETKETEFEVREEPRASVSTLDKLATPVLQPEKGACSDSAAEAGHLAVDQSSPFIEIADSATCNKASEEFSENLEVLSISAVNIQEGDRAELAHVEKPMDNKIERNHGASSLTDPVASGSAEVDQSHQVSSGCTSDPVHTESVRDKQEMLEFSVAENVKKSGGEVPSNPGSKDVSSDEGNFTFDVGSLVCQSKGEAGESSVSFPTIQAPKKLSAMEESPSTSRNLQVDPKIVPEIFDRSPLVPDGRAPSGGLKAPSERKARRGGGRSAKESGKKGMKETSSVKQNERGDKSHISLSPAVTHQVMQTEIVNVESSATKPSGVVSVPTSYLPDLNTTSSGLLQQPFTDLQQVQLRAQIFVYGSLIQGAAPDEACMVSAFDGGRSIWESSWRACVERLHGQKSQGNISETPLASRSGAKATDQAGKHSLPQSKAITSSAGRASSKGSLSPAVNPMIPLSSPLWSMSTPSSEGLQSSNISRSTIFDYQAVSPLHPYQTPPIPNFVASTTSWPSPATFPGPWVTSSQSSAINTQYSAFPITEPVKLTPVKELIMSISSGAKLATVPVAHSGALSALPVPFSLVDVKKAAASAGQNSADTKTRKRKKTSVAEDHLQSSTPPSQRDLASTPVISSPFSKKSAVVEDVNQFSLPARSQAEILSVPNVSSHYATSVTVSTPTFMPTSNPDKYIVAASPSVSSDPFKRGDSSMEKRVINLEDSNKVEEAKLQAEEAAAQAATAISHCQSVWSQLDKLKNAELTSDADAKLASAAVTVAAATAVAKAAAAAAKIASKAALQAKEMADDAVTKFGTASATRNNTFSLPMFANNLGNATPASILKGGDGIGGSSSIISAAREAAKKKVEVASAATRHAENLDAIVKAAELAAEAVSQAGKVAAMGDPLPLIQLVEAGPDGYWKVLHAPPLQASEPNDTNRNESNNNNSNRQGPDNEMLVQRALSRNIAGDQITADDTTIASVKHKENNSKAQKDRKASDSAKSTSIVSESDIESRSKSPILDPNGSTAAIREGCVVEVLKDLGDFKEVWFPANVLSLKDGEALVQYTKLLSEGGSEQLKEWVPLAAEDDKPPIIRIPHPMSLAHLEGTRKRSRAAVKDYAWSIGDRVDAWVEDCWREGLITEKNEKDETNLRIQFPGHGETSTVKAWNLRPTLIWSDGQWIESSRSRQDGTSQGDTPQEKRLKRGSSASLSKGKGKLSTDVEFGQHQPGMLEESRLLSLSASEKVFNIGTATDENKPDASRTVRYGLQKDGSRVIFGVPKPGKKRKFMDVSKHYVSDKSTKTNVPSDSVKLANYLMPQGSGSRGWKSNSKIDLKEKQAADSKSKAPNSGKPPIPSRMLSRKDDSASSKDDNESASSQETRRRALVTSTRSDRPNKGKLVPAARKPAKSDANDNPVPEGVEPRRSNRRIQPTSRLLEGLQSSLIISKVPASQDKINKNFSKGTSRRE